MLPVRCRDFRNDDLDGVAAAWAESWRSMALSIPSPLATEHGCRESIQRGVAAGWRIVVAQDGERTVGFLATIPDDRVLGQLFVSPIAKGRGSGAALLHLAMTDMPDGFWLRCAEANRVACLFYHAHGLRPERVEPHPVLGHPTVIYAWP